MARVIDNNGIGALYATFEINKSGADYDLTEADIGTAVVLAGNNKINHGADGGKLLGRLEHVAGGMATVQVAGVMRFSINSGKTAPVVGNAVVVDGAGEVYQAPEVATDPAGGNIAQGTVIVVNSTAGTCDVLM